MIISIIALVTLIYIILVLNKCIPILVTAYKYNHIIKSIDNKVANIKETSCYLENSIPDETKEYAAIECCISSIEECLLNLKVAIKTNRTDLVESILSDIDKYLDICNTHINTLETKTLRHEALKYLNTNESINT